jgi:16S rRNA (uracil1498-N3)-methyltransferase
MIDDHKKHSRVEVTDSRFTPHASRNITIAISLLKSSNRFEWFLEKATEIGIHEIIPLICKRTEKQKFREERMQNILISAMLHSPQCGFVRFTKPIDYELIFTKESSAFRKNSFHCIEEKRICRSCQRNTFFTDHFNRTGDFTNEEVQLAITNHLMRCH